jgi:hypothetical protein
MNRFRSLITISAFSLMVLCLPAIASAQYGTYGGYGGYGNGGYGNNGSYGDTRSTVRDLKNKARDFQSQLDRDLDHSRYNGSRREDQMNNLAREFRNAVNRLDSNNYNNGRYDNRNDYRLQEVFNIASQIERSIGRSGVSYNSQGIWQGIRYDLQRLGSGYNNNNRGGGRNNGGWNNGNRNGNRNGLPSWWPF